MTELEHDQDQWAGFPRLPDPLSGQPVPSVDGPAAQDLLVLVLGPEGGSSGNRGRRALARPWSIAAAVVPLMVVASTLLSGGGPAVAEPLLVAMDRTAALDSGRVEIEQTTSLGDASVTDRTTVRYRGGDEELVVSPDQSGSLPVPSGTIGTMTPVRMELRTVGGQNYVRVDLGTGLQPWASVELMGPQESFSAVVRSTVRGAADLDTCHSDAATMTYCLTTTDVQSAQMFAPQLESAATISARITVDKGTGLLTSFEYDMTDVTLFSPPGLELPTFDQLEGTWRYHTLDPNWTVSAPQVAPGTEPFQELFDACDAAGDQAAIERCLREAGIMPVETASPEPHGD